MESIESKKEEIIEIEPERKLNKKNILKISILLVSSLIIITTIFLIGYTKFGWFQKSQDNIISNIYHQDQVLLFNEFKTITTAIETQNGKENIEQTLDTDFIVTINSKTKLNYFGIIDYLYNATILITKVKSNDKVVNKLNIINKEETENFIVDPNIEHPLAKFSFFENGTLAEIYLVNTTSQYYASSLVDLIEQIIPKISREFYNNTQKIKNVEYEYDEENENPERKTISEKHQNKEFVDRYSKISFKGSQIKKRIKRKIFNDTLDQVTSESELNLISNKKENNNNGFYDIGLDGFSIKINSDLNMVDNNNDKNLIKIIENLSKNFEYEESQKLLEELSNNQMDELSKIIKEGEKNENIKNNNIRKLSDSIDQTYDLISINILGKQVNFKYTISYNNGQAEHSLHAVVGNVDVKVSTAAMSITGHLSGGISVPLCTIPFTLGIPLKFTLKASGNYDYSFVFTTNYKKEKNYLSVSGTLNAKLDGSLSTSSPFLSLSVGTQGTVVGLSGNKNLDIYNRKFTGTLKLSTGPVSLYVDVKLTKQSYHKILYTSGYLTKSF